MLSSLPKSCSRIICQSSLPPAPIRPSTSTGRAEPGTERGKGVEASQYDQYVEAFKAVDTDGSGTISKRELYVVLKKAGLTDTAQALELFQGFDQDADGSLDFEEFSKIARILC